MIIKRIGVLKLGMFQGLVGILFGLLAGLFILALGLSGRSTPGVQSGLGQLGSVMMVVILPIVYGIGLFITGIIGAALYNLVANLIGGIELDIE